MIETITALLMLLGGVFICLGAFGAVRLPDLLTRMQAATKASVLGASCTLLAAAIYHHDTGTTARGLATIAFICLTIPVAAHVIARAAYLLGVPLWAGTVMDELSGQYDLETRELRSGFDDRRPDEDPYEQQQSRADGTASSGCSTAEAGEMGSRI